MVGRPLTGRPMLLTLLLVFALAAPQDAALLERQLVAATRKAPDDFAAQRALGAFYLRVGRFADAIPVLERAGAIDPAHAANGYDLAVAYLETGRLDDASRQVQRLLADKETGALLHLQGEIAARAGDYTAAASGYQRAARLEPTEPHRFDWGNNLRRLRAYDDAADVFTASIRRHPQSARLRVGLGIAHYSRGRHEDAVTSFGEAADLDPADPRAIGFLGEM